MLLAERTQFESQAIVTEVYEAIHIDHDSAPVKDRVTLGAVFMGNRCSYEVGTTDFEFAQSLVIAFSKNVPCTLQQLGDLDIAF